MGKVGGGHETRRFPDLGNAFFRMLQHVLRFFTPDAVVVGQRGAAGAALERPQQLAAVDKKLPSHFLQLKVFGAVRFDIGNG